MLERCEPRLSTPLHIFSRPGIVEPESKNPIADNAPVRRDLQRIAVFRRNDLTGWRYSATTFIGFGR